MNGSIEQLKIELGVTDLRSDTRLAAALTHRSYAVENGIAYDNQRLEFLGDSVLDLILSERLFLQYSDADEGVMTKIRSALVCEAALAGFSRRLRLGEYLRLGNGELESHGVERDSTLADLFEAVLGAIYLDSGMEAARRLVLRLVDELTPDPKRLLAELNPKGMLQEFAQRNGGAHPEYRLLSQHGPDHSPVFEVEVSLGKYTALGRGGNRRAAESDAARTLYAHLNKMTAEEERCDA